MPAYYAPCQVELSQRLYIFSRRWHQHKRVLAGPVSLHKYDFPALIDDDSFLGSIRSLVQCERHERDRTERRHRTEAIPIPDFLIQSPFSRIVWHSHTFLPAWCRVVKWRGGLGFLYASMIMSRSVFLFGPGCAPCLQSLYPRVSRYWDGSQRANCVINNRGPMQREARWVFGGRELSPSQCWIDVTELRVLRLGGASTTLRKHTHIHKELAGSFPTIIICDFNSQNWGV